MTSQLNRRQYIEQTASVSAAMFALGTSPLAVSAERDRSAKLNLAFIGIGRRGEVNLKAMAEENIVAICDVDDKRLDVIGSKFSEARKYVDFRKLFQEEKILDGVVISTPDHLHAPAAMMAMNRGLNVYCEKPLTRTVGEARLVTETAARTKVITQMGTDSQGKQGFVETIELIEAGAIGDVREVHVWTNRPAWPQGQERPLGQDPVPTTLNWDLWLGPAPVRPFKMEYSDGGFVGSSVYHPFVWRGWWDFGCGALGDMAAHLMNVAFRALRLGAPSSIEAESSGMTLEAFPSWSIIRFEFPAAGKRPAVNVIWYDGGKKPSAKLFDEVTVGESGYLFVGDKGKIYGGDKRTDAEPLLLPAKTFAGYQRPTPTLPRYAEVHADWIRAIKEGSTVTVCPFSYGGPLTEAFLLGNIALKVGKKIEWDPMAFKVTNCPEANQYLQPVNRAGWEV